MKLLQAFLRRAAAHKALGKPLEAAEDFEHALRLEPTSKATMAERQTCLEQALQQAGLQNKPPRLAIPIASQSAQQQTQQPSISYTQVPKSQSKRESIGAAQASKEPATQQKSSSSQAVKAPDSSNGNSTSRSSASHQVADTDHPRTSSKPNSNSSGSRASFQYGGGKQPSVVIEELEADEEEQLPQPKVASSSSAHAQRSAATLQSESPQTKVESPSSKPRPKSTADSQPASAHQAKAPSAAQPAAVTVPPAEAAAASPSTAAALAEPESLQAGSKPASLSQSNTTQPASVRSKQRQADTAGLHLGASTAHTDSQTHSIQPSASAVQQPSASQPNTQAAPLAAQAGRTTPLQPGEAVSKLDKGQPSQTPNMSSASALGAREGHSGATASQSHDAASDASVAALAEDAKEGGSGSATASKKDRAASGASVAAAAAAKMPDTDHALKRHKAGDMGASQNEPQQAAAASPQLSTASAENAAAGSALPVPRSGTISLGAQMQNVS